jgi:glycosyltransferase involved in cell wall biosynthesis
LFRRPLWPVTAARYDSAAIRKRLAKLMDEVDGALFYQLRTVGWLGEIEPRRVLVDLTDALSLYYRRRAATAPWWGLEALRAVRLEQAVARRYTVAVVSEHDRRAIDPSGRWPVMVVPNGTWPPGAAYQRRPVRGRLLTVGNWSYYPNRSGLQRFLDQVWPLLCRRRPELELWVVGGGRGIYPLPPRVRWVGAVEALEPFYAEAEMAVAPLFVGAGMKTKVLEALAYQVPVVTTPVGAEGLSSQPGLRVVQAPEDWVQAIVDEPPPRLSSAPGPLSWEQTMASALAWMEGTWSRGRDGR